MQGLFSKKVTPQAYLLIKKRHPMPKHLIQIKTNDRRPTFIFTACSLACGQNKWLHADALFLGPPPATTFFSHAQKFTSDQNKLMTPVDPLLFLLHAVFGQNKSNDPQTPFFCDRQRPFWPRSLRSMFWAAVIFNEPQVFWSAVTNLRDSYSALWKHGMTQAHWLYLCLSQSCNETVLNSEW